jgi:hypothetical protein
MTKHVLFIMLPNAVYDSPAFAALAPIHIAMLLLLIRKHNGHNNGAIGLGVREAARRCHCSQATACRALERLQKDGFISATYKGHLVPESGRPDAATRWRLNFIQDSRPISAMYPPAQRFPNETAGCFLDETSPGEPVRFPGETSPRASLVKQSIDSLTRAKARGDGESECVSELAASPSGSLAGDGRKRPVAEQSTPGKPNGKDGVALRRGPVVARFH